MRNVPQGVTYFSALSSNERLEALSNNARLWKSDGYPRLPKIISILHHLRKWHWSKERIPRLPIQKRLGQKRRPSSLFCMGKREELAHRMAHFVKSCPIDFLFGIRGHEVFS